jgi:outer membrane protein assembly factor BamA
LAVGLATAQASRTDEILGRRLDKQANLFPERTTFIVKKLNELTERGLLEGARSGRGANGWQLVLGGMRSGNGMSFGLGYRRGDLWGERLGFRSTFRGTIQAAYMFDFLVDFPRLKSQRGELEVYFKYENSPMMDYYGPGPDSYRANRSSYRLEDASLDVRGRYRIWNALYATATAGVYQPNTGPGTRDDFPTTDEKFTPEETPGLGEQTRFLRAGAGLQYDYRDLAAGPRSGGNYYARFTRYWDQDLGLHTFHKLDAAAEQYLPYWNKTRVVALRLSGVLTYANEGSSVPFYLQPTLGGNEFLRGFARYRFYDQNALLAVAEHRWHLFSRGYAALFFEMGKVAAKASQINFHNLEYSGGIGFRFTMRDAVVMRIDNAVSREGYRLMWTFSNMW